jgi:hypothetical protein
MLISRSRRWLPLAREAVVPAAVAPTLKSRFPGCASWQVTLTQTRDR